MNTFVLKLKAFYATLASKSVNGAIALGAVVLAFVLGALVF